MWATLPNFYFIIFDISKPSNISWAEEFFLGLLGWHDAPGGSIDEGSFAIFPKGEDSEQPMVDNTKLILITIEF